MALSTGAEVIDLSVSSPLSSPTAPSKRKAAQDASCTASGKKPRNNGLVGLNEDERKLQFTQAPYDRRFFPRSALHNFVGYLMEAEEDKQTIDAIPPEYYGVIAQAGHEQTCATEAQLIKSIKAIKGLKDASNLKDELLPPLISSMFTLTNYGFRHTDFGVSASRFPAGLQIRCWEVADLDKYFPADRLPELRARIEERMRARKEVEGILANMDDVEKAHLLRSEKRDERKDEKKADKEAKAGAKSSAPTSPARPRPERSMSPSSSALRSPSPPPPAKAKLSLEEEEEARKKQEEREAKKLEREEKRKEKEERKAAKEREVQKKAVLKAKQSSALLSFFGKAKAAKPLGRVTPVGPSKATLTDYQRTFRPFVRRANVEVAPINRWIPEKKGDTVAQNEEDVSNWGARDFLMSHCKRNRTPRQAPPRQKGLKTSHPFGSVAEAWEKYQTVSDPREVATQLLDTNRFPWKTLSFHTENRPPYSGTHTKASVVIGPRTPFAQDPGLDYSYDSGDEWVEDEGGEDVDEQMEESDGEEEDDDDSDMDDFFDDQNDPLMEPDGDAAMADPLDSAPMSSPNRLVPRKKINLVPKRVTKLNPTVHGPMWEANIAEPISGFESYQIQLLNDTPASIDPFEYVSAEPAQVYTASYSDTVVGMQQGVKCLLSSDQVTVKAAKPTPVAAPAAPLPLGDASAAANVAAAPAPAQLPQKLGRGPKIAFPVAKVPELLRLIDGNNKILSDLISFLKHHFDACSTATTKAAIEAKVREVATREGKAKDSVWRVKAEAWRAVGVEPPKRGIAALASMS